MKRGYVSGSVCDVHRHPDHDAEVVTQAKLGEGLGLLELHGDWHRVITLCDGYEGYVETSSLTEGDWAEAALAAPRMAAMATVRNLRANVYSGPRVLHRLLATVPMGVKLPYGVSSSEGWLATALAGGQEGFIQARHLDLDGTEWAWRTLPELRRSLVRTAKRFLGVQYRWGGTSSFGLDCSGFVQHMYALHGLALPRDADQQAQSPATVQVRREEALPGDLVFFADYGHVGLVSSHFDFIHATTTRTRWSRSAASTNRIGPDAGTRPGGT